jgi:hypothetical protein
LPRSPNFAAHSSHSSFGGFIGAALLLPTKPGEALVQFRVGKALEAFKAQQSGELERLKEQLNHVGDRGSRSNEMEFAAIETVWWAFVKAWLSTNTCVGSMTTIPRFDTMSDDETRSFLSGAGLNEGEQNSVLHAADKTKKYTSIRDWQRITDTGSPAGYPAEPLVSYQINRQLSGWNLPPLGDPRLRGALPNPDLDTRSREVCFAVTNRCQSRANRERECGVRSSRQFRR